jgi:hypothetical protein
MLKKLLPVTWWSYTIWIAVTYIIATDLIPNVLLVLINSAGYLPYSDRPGPGWQPPHFPTGHELGFFTGFAILLLPATAIYGLAFALSGLVLGFCRLPRWLVRIMAAPPAFIAAGLMMDSVGWFIAISALGVYVAAGSGALWAIFIFPALLPTMGRTLPVTARIALPLIVVLGGTYVLVRPLLPDPALTNAKVEVIKKSVAGAELSNIDLSYIGLLAGNVNGHGKYVPIYWGDFTTDNRNQVRALLIIDDDRPSPHTFVLPRKGEVIYRQSGGQWNQERGGGRNSKLSLELTSDSAGGVQLQIKGPCCSSMTQHFGPIH